MGLNRKMLMEMMQSGMQGENPYVKAQSDQAASKLQAYLKGKENEQLAGIKGQEQTREHEYKTSATRAKEGYIEDGGGYKPGTDVLGKHAEQTNASGTLGKLMASAPEGSGASVNGVAYTKGFDPHAASARQQKSLDLATKDISKRYEELGPYNSALQELEKLTDSDGKGGILTNPNAKLLSTGMLKSKLSNQAMGMAEYLNGVPKGASAERSALAMLADERIRYLSGKSTTEQERKSIKDAQGWIASGDPALVQKGARAIAKIAQKQYGVIRSGYPKEAVDLVHERMKGDPSALYESLYQDLPFGADSAPPPAAPPGRAPGAAPQGASMSDIQKQAMAEKQRRDAEKAARGGR